MAITPMMKTRLRPLAAALVLSAAATTANANVIDFADSAQTAGLGATVTLDITMDFVDTTVGGSFDIVYDAGLLSFVSFEFDDAFLDLIDPAFTVLPDNCLTDGAAIAGCDVGDPELNGIAFGNFDGISGELLIGSVTFQTLDLGIAAVTMATNDAPWEGFIDLNANEMLVLYGPGTVRVVPLPAGLWLLLSAVGLAGAVRRNRA
ncbi:MAG: hypothetical protein AAGD86_10980 [Pseudomonadota bacterium]